MPEITMTRVCTQMSPRRRIAELTADTELPIRGGWGYTREDAVIIDRQDRVVSKCMPFDGLAVERAFIEGRIYQDLWEPLEVCGPLLRTTHALQMQGLQMAGDKVYDVISHDVWFYSLDDWNAVLKERRALMEQGVFHDQAAEFWRQKDLLRYHYVAEYVFEISSFFYEIDDSPVMKRMTSRNHCAGG